MSTAVFVFYTNVGLIAVNTVLLIAVAVLQYRIRQANAAMRANIEELRRAAEDCRTATKP